MVHFFGDIFNKLLDEKNEVASGYGMFLGWMVNIFTFQYQGLFLGIWGTVITSISGVVLSVITAMSLIIVKDFYEHKVKDKLFKKKKDANTKKQSQPDNEKAA